MELNANISAVVTGGASGLGEATARKLAALGVKVGIIDMNEEKGQALAKELGGAFAKVNVTSDEEVARGFAELRAAIGQERLLINCAGIGDAVKTASRDRETGAINPHSMKRFQRVLDINLSGTFRCIAESAAGMMTLDPIDGERGSIVNTASAAAEDGQVGQAAYSASKAGIVGMTLPIARDLSRELIRVNTILPGIFDTPLLASAPEPVRQALGAMVPHPARLGMPEEFASLAAEMCRNSYFNGEDVRLDGAIRMAPK
ncbi:SDR family NAD(P)-dependent oxidoreductase [bacterium]|jgi:NAD(P)-dependent dehydrogenase (short-subunit alcohol dehydrogenase family)|nr:SDR family NAD(P)-dependent oxidoreductase [Porticoccaceae bacterium]MDB4322131.1 SDR family NAD(P)-dependent oxidoreductase [bacterium]MDB9814645.1 SDR family NAD(P)-dependent oxidoreductase [bacterium]MDB9951830.1 SDR family NAD(P)-dependent oxidoreductase [Porticoccaceae bacterium]MDC0003175.1 SDR family NAD(P)-dependent oxidoreductase [Porticoccaceae bacterium]